jgi:hypothetical protein
MPLVGVLRINTPATNEPGATMLRPSSRPLLAQVARDLDQRTGER